MFQQLVNRSIQVRQQRRVTNQIDLIRTKCEELNQLSDHDLKQESQLLRYYASAGKPVKHLLPDAYALVSEVSRRVYSMVPYDVQLAGSIHLLNRTIVEMATGEGKSLTALLPLYLRAIEGKGAFLATANDYLAGRDAEFAKPVFDRLGLTAGVVIEKSSDEQRRHAYACDVTYGTAAQFGFDFLRDRAKRRFNYQFKASTPESTVGRGRLYSVLIDEADSLLIDEAATPLLLSGTAPSVPQEKQDAYRWAARLAPRCQESIHYRYKKIDKKSELNAVGKKWVHRQLPAATNSGMSLIDYYDFVERAINVHRDLLPGRNYVVNDSEVQLVDEGTGRIGKGRQWSEGIHQAVQAKENLPITLPSGHLAKVTVQSFFLAFENISGMTGTGKQAQAELRNNYRLTIREIPTRLPTGRFELPALAFTDASAWLEAIRNDCMEMQKAGRAILIGARSVAQSEKISQHLFQSGIDNQLLNARRDDIEAEVISHAGQPSRVTVATNMAGRGTDISLHPSVKKSGGLHVILAGIHQSKRTDRQLIGRSGRQGDPGSYRKILCLEDDLLDEAYDTAQAAKFRKSLSADFTTAACLERFEHAQQLIATRNRTRRSAIFFEEKKSLKYLSQAGIDPLLDIPG